MTITTTGFQLHPWQRDAVRAWVAGTDQTPYRGTFEIVTGGGKTLIALACLAEASRRDNDLRAAIVVPTEALARQWRDNIVARTSLTEADVGLLGAGGKATFKTARVVVAVLNTASSKLPALAASAGPLMLIVDECHRAGAPKFRKVLDTPAVYRLGLSATPDREELNDEGELLTYDEQAVGQALGSIVYRFTLKDARLSGWLPEFTLHHHGVALSPDEQRRYDAVSRRVDEAGDELRSMGIETARARSLASSRHEAGAVARRWVQLTAQRKDLLYRAHERQRVARQIVEEVFADGERHRVILFHERVDEAVRLFEELREELTAAELDHGILAPVRVELEHSKLADKRRRAALAAFSSGEAPVLVSVKSLVEGIDVPEADTGVSVASTSSVRQRVQALGRVLRRVVDDDGASKSSTMHLIYVEGTVDDLIYAKADWSDLTGEDANRYWKWRFESAIAEPQEAPPRTPLPTEEQVWAALGERMPEDVIPWPGVLTGQEYSVKTNGVVNNAFGSQIVNPQDVAEMVARVRGREGGRFRVTPEYLLVLVWEWGDPGQFVLVGRLREPFRALSEEATKTKFDVTALRPGQDYPGPGDKTQGSYKVSQRGGGQISRAVRGGAEFAFVDGSGDPSGEGNARRVLEAWEAMDRGFARFSVNNLGHAWTEGTGGRVFVADVTGGFSWPKERE
ncbi:DEAD/DEAH box helicase [Terrabacter sp. MAHUQ-38]|uniref:DEAD/DEAH box helicase n=1 Tax=unclassified Terrabacter TaxID=2630222 RepID=UPI00165D5AED|nr:DEAD/DEAH box helicase [Terrabacter sp. MAHUQ-38]MBC9820512.1 DEAD/DEAH box helicase [Terrabacter sp. MAHUQ-38]